MKYRPPLVGGPDQTVRPAPRRLDVVTAAPSSLAVRRPWEHGAGPRPQFSPPRGRRCRERLPAGEGALALFIIVRRRPADRRATATRHALRTPKQGVSFLGRVYFQVWRRSEADAGMTD